MKDRNLGFMKSRTFVAGSREVSIVGRIYADIFFQERHIFNEVNAKIKLIRSNDAFCMMATGG